MSQTVNTTLTILADVSQTAPTVIVRNPVATETFLIDSNGNVGSGNKGAPETDTNSIPFWVENSFTNPAANSHGLVVTSQRVTSTNPGTVTQTSGLLLQNSTTSISSSIVDTGRITGISAYSWRNASADAGMLAVSESLELVYGHGSAPFNSIETDNVYGIRMVPCANKGNINNLYDIFITTPQLAGGSIDNHYAIYQQDASASNYFAGTVDVPSIKIRNGAVLSKVWTCVDGSGAGHWATASGATGSQGRQGFQGAIGNQGSQGNQGFQGSVGTQGFQGNIGNQGFQGTTGTVGSQGVQGIAGVQGSIGNQGFQGTTGTTGSQGNQGFQGSVGTQGVIGNQGFQGNTGTTGTTGSQGNQGFQGSVGTQGNQGDAGTIGTQGFQGSVGTQGNQGLQGSVGTQGNQGVAGSGVAAGSDTHIQFNNSGSFAGSTNLTWNNANRTFGVQAGTSQSADLFQVKNISGVVQSYFDSNGYAFPRTFVWSLGLGTSVTTGTDVANWVIVPRAGKAVKVFIAAKTAPTGASLILDIQKSTDGGSSFTSLWNSTPGNRPTLTATSKTASSTSFDVTSLAEGDLLRIDVVQTGSSVPGQDLNVSLLALMKNN